MNPKEFSSPRNLACRALVLPFLFLELTGFSAAGPTVEDGYGAWLRYAPVAPADAQNLALRAKSIAYPQNSSPTLSAAARELELGLSSLLSRRVPLNSRAAKGSILLGTPRTSPEIAALSLPLSELGPDGYLIRETRSGSNEVTIIAANEDTGVLHGVFALLRHAATAKTLARIEISAKPRHALRLLNHWDNLDGTIERGYAGQSLWDWWKLPQIVDPRYTDYARLNASLGINGAVLNNVNARAASLTAPYIAKAAALASVFRPYGIRVYLSARFSAPIEIGGLKTADPLDPAVRAFWKSKAGEIYAAIPDFGGFLVKANSEGQPGPQDYKRTHAEGANALAEAVASHKGVVIWRAFVYAQENPEDRAKQAYNDFRPLDGKFAPNVIVQVKNGPIDFQPREPFHPLFGAMPKTPLMMELQITKEYLGFATHLAYLGTMFKEVLDADTHAKGKGSTVARVVDGSMDGHALSGMAGVANIGNSRMWSGSHFDQANWYAFGRLAWDPGLSAKEIAEEWTRQTFTNDERFAKPVVDMMMRSRQAVVDYMTPLGLAHLMGTGHHYGPAPWISNLRRPEWNPAYYHRATADHIGFNRTRSGSDAVSQYAGPVGDCFADIACAGDDYLLWFHEVSWDLKLRGGRTVWEEMVARMDRGVAETAAFRETWKQMEPYVDAQRHAHIDQYFAVQEKEARWWRDANVAYFADVSKRPLPNGARPPEHTLDYYKQLRFLFAPGN